MTVVPALATICGCIFAFFLYRLNKSNEPINTHFPPGPRGWLWSILGNIKDLSVDPSMLHMHFASWRHVYGSLHPKFLLSLYQNHFALQEMSSVSRFSDDPSLF